MNSNKVIIINYSERSIAVVGAGVQKYKEQFKRLGGIYNRNLSFGPGWVFKKAFENKVRNLVGIKTSKRRAVVLEEKTQSKKRKCHPEPEPNAFAYQDELDDVVSKLSDAMQRLKILEHKNKNVQNQISKLKTGIKSLIEDDEELEDASEEDQCDDEEELEDAGEEEAGDEEEEAGDEEEEEEEWEYEEEEAGDEEEEETGDEEEEEEEEWEYEEEEAGDEEEEEAGDEEEEEAGDEEEEAGDDEEWEYEEEEEAGDEEDF